jgi:ribosomal protein L12E/L44/L45/RPP1/RPP2
MQNTDDGRSNPYNNETSGNEAYWIGHKLIGILGASISTRLDYAVRLASADRAFMESLDHGMIPHFVSLALLDFCGRPFNRIEIKAIVEALGFEFSEKMAEIIGSFHFGSHFVRIAIAAFLESAGAEPTIENIMRLERILDIVPAAKVTEEAIGIYTSAHSIPQATYNHAANAVDARVENMMVISRQLSIVTQLALEKSLKEYLQNGLIGETDSKSLAANFFASVATMFAGYETVDSGILTKILSASGIKPDEKLVHLLTKQGNKNYLMYVAAAFTIAASNREVTDDRMLAVLRAMSVRPYLSTVKYAIEIMDEAGKSRYY